MAKLKIVADSNILAVKSLQHADLDLQLISGREISARDLVHADALLVRSVTRVDRNLLGGSSVRFVGTATSGTDHIDIGYLRAQNIELADARGSNANAVVDYCFAALAFAILRRNLKLERCRVGIIGCGHVGSLFASKLRTLGVHCRICDPPLEQRLAESGIPETPAAPDTIELLPLNPTSGFCSLEEALQCEIVSLHVPLVTGGPFPTRRLLGERELLQLQPTAMLINTCRGSVVSEAAMLARLQEFDGITYVADVWENEPHINPDLARIADIATPHIAGYSLDAKLSASQMLFDALTAYFSLPPIHPAESVLKHELALESDNSVHGHWQYLLDMFALTKLSEDFKNSVRQGNTAIQFDAMRKRLLARREFSSHVVPKANLNPQQQEFLRLQGVEFN